MSDSDEAETGKRSDEVELDVQDRASSGEGAVEISPRLTALEERLSSLEESLSVEKAGRDTRPNGQPQQNECGCKEGCPCCIEIYISGLQFLRNDLFDGNMEIIVAVKAGDTWGLLPGLTSYVLLDKNESAIIPFHSTISRMCVDCGICKSVPILAHALEVVQKNGALEGRPESGAAESAIVISCDCPTTKTFLAVPFAKKEGGEVNGVVGVEISSRLSANRCC